MTFTVNEVLNILKYSKISTVRIRENINQRKNVKISKDMYQYNPETDRYDITTQYGKVCKTDLDVILNCQYYDTRKFVYDHYNIDLIIETNDIEKLKIFSKYIGGNFYYYDFESKKFKMSLTNTNDRIDAIVKNKLPFKYSIDGYVITCNNVNGKYELFDVMNYITKDDIELINYYKLMESV